MHPRAKDPRLVVPPTGIGSAGPRPRITVVISSLSIGGAERVITELANDWVGRGWEITIVHFSIPGTPPYFPLDPRVREVPLGLHRVSRSPLDALRNNLRRIRVLRRAIRTTRPELVLSLMNRTNILTVFAATGLGLPVVVCEHTAPRGTLTRPWRILRGLAYRRATFVVMLTAGALAELPAALRRRGRVIPNPLPAQFLATVEPSADGHGATPAGGPTVMGLGRLTPEKGFDLLIEAFAQLADAWPTARLVIWGEGGERDRLERIRASHDLGDRVDLPGETRVPEQVLRAATVFVLSSRLEGMPMALLEAMALGRAVVACDCDHGPRDIVRDGLDGVLVPPEDVGALAGAIGALLGDDVKRVELGRRAVEVRERFALDAITAEWERLFDDAKRAA
jgi:glycosyltransferase involved in cell wall biosynthesis